MSFLLLSKSHIYEKNSWPSQHTDTHTKMLDKTQAKWLFIIESTAFPSVRFYTTDVLLQVLYFHNNFFLINGFSILEFIKAKLHLRIIVWSKTAILLYIYIACFPFWTVGRRSRKKSPPTFSICMKGISSLPHFLLLISHLPHFLSWLSWLLLTVCPVQSTLIWYFSDLRSNSGLIWLGNIPSEKESTMFCQVFN